MRNSGPVDRHNFDVPRGHIRFLLLLPTSRALSSCTDGSITWNGGLHIPYLGCIFSVFHRMIYFDTQRSGLPEIVGTEFGGVCPIEAPHHAHGKRTKSSRSRSLRAILASTAGTGLWSMKSATKARSAEHRRIAPHTCRCKRATK